MPLYDYKCEAGHKYELREPFGSPAHHPCQKCGKPAHRVLHARPIMFKGSGWYSTDSRAGSASSSRRPSSSSTSDSGSDGGNGKSEGKSESKGSSKQSEARAEANDSASKKSDSSSSKKAKSPSD